MDAAGFAAMFNLRHKLALCATLVCVGLIVLFDGGVRPAVGIGLLGIAFSWAFGSNYRLVHWLFVVFGLLLLVPMVKGGIWWHQHRTQIIKFDTERVALDDSIIQRENEVIRLDHSAEDVRNDESSLDKDYDELYKNQRKLYEDQANGIVRYTVKRNWATATGGALLLSTGIGLVVGFRKVREEQGPAALVDEPKLT